MLNIGPPELILIFVIALVIVGPQRLPELGRTIGKGLREFRKMQDDVKDLVNTGMGDEFKQTAAELKRDRRRPEGCDRRAIGVPQRVHADPPSRPDAKCAVSRHIRHARTRFRGDVGHHRRPAHRPKPRRDKTNRRHPDRSRR